LVPGYLLRKFRDDAFQRHVIPESAARAYPGSRIIMTQLHVHDMFMK
jgi:hypothetical protein